MIMTTYQLAKKYLYLILLIISLPAMLQAQELSVSGTVTDQNGKPVSYATVFVVETKDGVSTNEDGTFKLTGLNAGTYNLQITRIGHKTIKKTVEVQNGIVLNFSLEEDNTQLNEVTVTATRTSRAVENVPLPVEIISEEQIEQMGSFRLNEVLMEQAGLQIVSDHGTGLQMQGLSSDYIKILIDGEPVIGRTAGTLDLSRISVNNIAQIEVLRGPSSSLYGSEAMAGVVNIITKKDKSGFNSSLRMRYRTFNTINTSANASYSSNKLSASLFVDRMSSDGYDLAEETIAKTAPPYESYTFNPKVSYKFSDKVKLQINGRYYTETQENTEDLTLEEGSVARVDNEANQSDWNLMPTLNININDDHKLQLRSYTTGYNTDQTYTYESDGGIYDESYFEQIFNRTEVQYDWYISDKHITTLGAGHYIETVEATRYDDVNAFRANYGFIQHQWIPTNKFNVIVGGRFDTHSEYKSRFSPKIAAGYQVNDWVKVQASFGGGYKAPDFRQLLLNFTNPTVGYTVIGSSIVQDRIAELEAQGLIQSYYMDPSDVETIKAETSIAYNFGVKLKPVNKLHIDINAFRNEISNLINSTPIALKTNGQSVFSYVNMEEVITQGVELKADYKVLDNLSLSLGYQYLDARDVAAVESIKNGEVYTRDPSTNLTSLVTMADYGGLVNRSRHTGNVKVYYYNNRYDFDLALRGIYRGKWGYGDANGNGVVDLDSEYADGYFLLNLAVNKNLFGWLTVEAGANNLLDKVNIYQPTVAGRLWYGGINLKFPNSNN